MGQSAGDNHCEPVTRTKLKMNKSIIALLLIAQVFSSPLPQDPNDDAEVFGGPVRTNTDYESDSFPDTFGGLFPRVRVFVVPSGPRTTRTWSQPSPAGDPPLEMSSTSSDLSSVVGARYSPPLMRRLILLQRRGPASSALSSKTALMMFRTTSTRSGTDRMRLTLIPRKMVLTLTTLLILLRCWRMVRLFTLTKLLLLTLTRMETLSSSTKLSSTTSVPMTT